MYFLIKYLVRWWRERQGQTQIAESSTTPKPAPQRAPRASRDTGPSAASRGPIAMVLHQVRFDLLTSLRNPRARFFTFFFPILLLVVFNGVWGSGHTTVDGVHVTLSRFYVPGILAMSVVTASYAGLVISISTARETGVLKRRRATPVPPGLLIAGQALATVAITAVMATLLLVISKVGYGVGFAPASIAVIAITVILGTITLSCVAYAVAGMIGSAEAAQPIVQATMLPLWFVSGVFIPTSNLSSGVRAVGDAFPVAHLANLFHLASVHSSFGASASARDLLALAAWGVAAAAFSAWRFSWLPSTATA